MIKVITVFGGARNAHPPSSSFSLSRLPSIPFFPHLTLSYPCNCITLKNIFCLVGVLSVGHLFFSHKIIFHTLFAQDQDEEQKINKHGGLLFCPMDYFLFSPLTLPTWFSQLARQTKKDKEHQKDRWYYYMPLYTHNTEEWMMIIITITTSHHQRERERKAIKTIVMCSHHHDDHDETQKKEEITFIRNRS